ncbi:DUF2608 domain-containing protein [Candidatus Dependentiae bacterium]|jgi:hypothetical protein|nr:DUF2608 domain-containing protein [Candidatus Dependentiae bacterium]
MNIKASVKLLLFVFGFNTTYTQVFPVIIESDDIWSVKENIDSNAKHPVVIFDIDNTLLRAELVMARDECFDARLKQELAAGLAIKPACDKVLPGYFEAMQVTHVSLVDENSVAMIKELQERGIVVIALTARSPHVLEECTLRQLESVGINFRITSPTHEKDLNFAGLTDRADFKGGVIFCGCNDKGKVLERFFNETDLHPDQIIFTDDKEKNLSAVEREANELNIPCVCIRYSKLDQAIQGFDLTQLEQ